MNYFKTLILFLILTSILIAIGYLLAGTNGLVIALVFSVLSNFILYWFSDKIVLSANQAVLIDPAQIPTLYEDIKAISNQMNIPVPKVYITPALQPNAFATGRNPGNSAIAFTQGLLQNLNREEIKGVLAHELSHIKNHDILISTIAAVIGSAISSVGDIFLWGNVLGGDNRRRTNPIGMVILLITAPIIAVITQLAISRTREYAADETGSRYTQEPLQLANALIKIHNVALKSPMQVNSSIAQLYIENPFPIEGIAELFSTHPPIEKRVERLQALNNEINKA